MPSALEAARQKEPARRSAYKGKTKLSPVARAVAAASSSPRRASSSPPPRPRPGSPKVIVLAGPTASGKSTVSLTLAKILDGEVVNADSVQVYRGLDVGSAKLPLEDREGIPHHLIDVAEPLSGDFSAGSFYSLAREAIQDILSRGKTPIVVGGTGLYLRWLVHGRPSTKPSSEKGRAWAQRAFDDAIATAEAAKRKEIGGGGEGDSRSSSSKDSVLTKEERWGAACSALAVAGDPEAAARILKELNNEYRLLRALAALYEAGPGVTLGSLEAPGLVGGVKNKKKSEGKEEEDEEAGADAAPSSSSSPPPRSSPPRASPPLLDFDFRCFFLHASTRELAYRRIDERAEGIVAGGLFSEAAALLSRGALPAACSATRAIGYRQAMEGILEVLGRGGEGGEGGEGVEIPQTPLPATEDVRAVAAATQAASRRLAHSQYTWFRGDPLYRWVAVPLGSSRGEVGEERDPVSVAAKEIAACFALPTHDPRGKLHSSDPSSPHPSDGRLTKEEEQALRRYVPRLTLLATEHGMRKALASFSAAVTSVPEGVARAAREEAAKRRRQRESTM